MLVQDVRNKIDEYKRIAAERLGEDWTGCSIHLSHYGQPSWGYLVSLSDFETVGVHDACFEVVQHNIGKTLGHFCSIMPDLLDAGEYCLGVWLNPENNLYYVDISIHCDTIHDAAKIAFENQQIAIWDCENCRSIDTNTLIDSEGNLR